MHDEPQITSVFFYGLFMDEELLTRMGLHPSSTRIAYVPGYGIRVGERATLERSSEEYVFGSVMDLTNAEIQRLYRERSVADYVPVQLVAIDMQGGSHDVVSYILPMAKLSGSDGDYARSLALTATKIGLPGDYIDIIETWAQGNV